MRVYIPATMSQLSSIVQDTGMPVRSGIGFAVTASLKDMYHEGDDEELEMIAFDEAARASLRLLSGEEEHPNRRVVVSVDIDNPTPAPEKDIAVVHISPAVVHLTMVAAVHVDGADTAEVIQAAIEAVDRADLGDEDAEFTVGDALDIPLAWYAPSEVPFLIELR